ncbi:MAG TPA: deoxyribonuclease IV, partial [Gaiellaceae bacterium]|nr:deoxyribonuclease IV [Gaiellaceae bacterium]
SLAADGVVLHVGSHLGAGLEAGLGHAVPALEEALERCSDVTWLLLENSAGAGGTVGRSIEELAVLVDRLGAHPRVGVCLDSCHLWVSGVDVTDGEALDAVVAEVDGRIGLERLRCLHVNDAAAGIGSNRDRHANLGEGELGDALGRFLAHPRLQELPAILEVPGKDGHGPDADEVRKLRDLHARWTRGRARARRGRSPRTRAKSR